MNERDFERDFYAVFERDGIKYVQLFGWIEERDDHITEFDASSYAVFVAGEVPDDLTFPWLNHDGRDYSWDEEDEVMWHVRNYFGTGEGTHLPLRDVTQETPGGHYWCTFDEEPGRDEEE